MLYQLSFTMVVKLALGVLTKHWGSTKPQDQSLCNGAVALLALGTVLLLYYAARLRTLRLLQRHVHLDLREMVDAPLLPTLMPADRLLLRCAGRLPANRLARQLRFLTDRYETHAFYWQFPVWARQARVSLARMSPMVTNQCVTGRPALSAYASDAM